MGDGCLALIKLCVAGAAMKKSPDLDLDRAPYVLYGVKYIDLVSLAPLSGRVHHESQRISIPVTGMQPPNLCLDAVAWSPREVTAA